MTARDWDMLTAPELGDPLADIEDWMIPPYMPVDIEKQRERGENND